ncbi:hypothetical protein G8770_21090 [Aestuariicella hydrocarbonica]|uniref:Lipoprotein n=1 Tax=Pseudomaricurvus hydrocarbonicus TaxID=1470433 RepID=A0A9E5MPH8_9GAMM|nr:hypothetical protein [Aestuariicella hydrocarbonica]NHO68051.1 hypothetical protein [Aestuariicella hydrocarbonica]
MQRWLWLVVVFSLWGCAADPAGFSVKGMAKTDIDLVADIHRRATKEILYELTTKMYRRNPDQLKKTNATIDSRWQQIQALAIERRSTRELGGRRGVEAMRLAFETGYTGDRVFALMVGLTGMLAEAYGYKQEFYWLDSLDQQSLYNSARNIEVMVWLLRSRRDASGEPLILTDTLAGELVNLSFERLFGKLIAHQDALSHVMAGKTQRAVNTVAHGLVSMTFKPL